MILLGIAGHIGAGKDTVAAFLSARYGFVRRGWADALKLEVAARLPRTLRTILRTLEPEARPDEDWAWWDARLRRALWEDRHPIVRALLQEYGTEVRRADDPDYWVKAWCAWSQDWGHEARVVVPDTRFVNEAEAIRRRGGLLIRVERPGHEGDAHASEHGLEDWTDWSAVFTNDGTVPYLHAKVRAWASSALRFDGVDVTALPV